MIIAVQTLNGIAIAVDSPHLAAPDECVNLFPVNQGTMVGYHDTLDLGQEMVEQILNQRVDQEGDVVSIANQAVPLFNEYVTHEGTSSAIGFLFFGYTNEGEGAMLGWYHVGEHTRSTRFFPLCNSNAHPVAGYLTKKVYAPDMSLARALELVAYQMRQGRIVRSHQPVPPPEGLTLAMIHPESGCGWIDRETTEAIVKKNESRDQALRIQCADLFLDDA
jgi:hypothetical protein